MYLDGNHAITKIENRSITGDQKEKKLLMIKDSLCPQLRGVCRQSFRNRLYGGFAVSEPEFEGVDGGTGDYGRSGAVSDSGIRKREIGVKAGL